MLAALRGSYVEYVTYTGITEKYPVWFHREILDDIYMDQNRFTFWAPEEERGTDYYEKTLVEDYSVFLRKTDGSVLCTTYDVFSDLYVIFKYDAFTNSGMAAFKEDTIEYVECQPGVLSREYPDWFYEFFTEAAHFPQEEESIFIFDVDTTDTPLRSSKYGVEEMEMGEVGQVSVDDHCVFLRNHLNEIMHMEYYKFLEMFNPGPGNWFGTQL